MARFDRFDLKCYQKQAVKKAEAESSIDGTEEQPKTRIFRSEAVLEIKVNNQERRTALEKSNYETGVF